MYWNCRSDNPIKNFYIFYNKWKNNEEKKEEWNTLGRTGKMNSVPGEAKGKAP